MVRNQPVAAAIYHTECVPSHSTWNRTVTLTPLQTDAASLYLVGRSSCHFCHNYKLVLVLVNYVSEQTEEYLYCWFIKCCSQSIEHFSLVALMKEKGAAS